ncbi:MAG: hypothetical protein IPK14_11690 [Blastocatellia bacterium]|nr:hypothetical protein [Blastocatellia bacterium]
MENVYPTFLEATESFRKFLMEQGQTDKIVWIDVEDVVLVNYKIWTNKIDFAKNYYKAEEKYNLGTNKMLGIELSAICRLGDNICSHVFVPNDKEDALNHLMLGNLKLAVPQNCPLLNKFGFLGNGNC